jgi:hypothetical protein
MSRFQKPSPEAIQAVQREAARRLTPEELRARLAVPFTESERAEALALLRWFRRRYPTPAARLASARRAARSWLDSTSPLGAPPPLHLPEEPVLDPQDTEPR